MGQRMLAGMAVHPRFRLVCAWDPAEPARRETAARYPELGLAEDPGRLLGDPQVSVVYIASPPARHVEYAAAALAAGKAVYCEKPLGVELAESRALTEQAERSGRVNLVNFPLASAPAARELERRLAAGELGTLAGLDIRLRFARWPRAWQAGAASWLARRAQGGLAREVLSHWIYLAERLLGPTRLEAAAVRYPGGELAETHVLAQLVSRGGVPVSVAAGSGGTGPDQVECTLWGSEQSCCVFDWSRLRASRGEGWQEVAVGADLPPGAQPQLDHAAAALAGEPHSMPGFREALAVQERIEAILARGAP
jgi:predicted dehydrogenase